MQRIGQLTDAEVKIADRDALNGITVLIMDMLNAEVNDAQVTEMTTPLKEKMLEKCLSCSSLDKRLFAINEICDIIEASQRLEAYGTSGIVLSHDMNYY